MSALRVAAGVYRDPYTRAPMDPTMVVELPITPPAPPIRRWATPDELARLAPKPTVDANREARRIRGGAILEAARLARAAARDAAREAVKAERARLRREARAAFVPKPRAPRPSRGGKLEARRVETMARLADALRVTNGNRTKAGALIGMSKGNVSYLVARYQSMLPADVPILTGWMPPVPQPRYTSAQLLEAIRLEDGHRWNAAHRLGITPATMYRRLRGVEIPDDLRRDGRCRA